MTQSSGALSVLGMNGRNIDYISVHNRRTDYGMVDDKLKTKRILEKAGIPCPRLFHAYHWFWELRQIPEHLGGLDSFVMKPARGLAGKGVLVLKKKDASSWTTPSGHLYTLKDLVDHAGSILYGVYSIDNTTDTVIVEQRLVQDSFFNNIFPNGISDVRVILFKGRAAMAMCRIPTAKSDGKANITLGAVGAGIDLNTGMIIHAANKQGSVSRHPDTGEELTGKVIPHWEKIMEMASRIQYHFPLGYLGADIVVDKDEGPLILELNARPGLEIQNANQKGLKAVLMSMEAVSG